MDREKEKGAIRHSRRLGLQAVLKSSGDTHDAAAGKLNTSPAYISQMVTGHRAIGDDLAGRIEKAYRKPVGWMDRQREEKSAKPPPVAQRDFLEEDLAVLHRLTNLNDEMRIAITSVINAAYEEATKPRLAKPARRTSKESAIA